MSKDDDVGEEIERLEAEAAALQRELDDVTEERDELQNHADFREKVRDALGLHWDASDEMMLRQIRESLKP